MGPCITNNKESNKTSEIGRFTQSHNFPTPLNAEPPAEMMEMVCFGYPEGSREARLHGALPRPPCLWPGVGGAQSGNTHAPGEQGRERIPPWGGAKTSPRGPIAFSQSAESLVEATLDFFPLKGEAASEASRRRRRRLVGRAVDVRRRPWARWRDLALGPGCPSFSREADAAVRRSWARRTQRTSLRAEHGLWGRAGLRLDHSGSAGDRAVVRGGRGRGPEGSEPEGAGAVGPRGRGS